MFNVKCYILTMDADGHRELLIIRKVGNATPLKAYLVHRAKISLYNITYKG